MSPKRIQMSRQHPWRADNPDAVIVARPSKWGNPYKVVKVKSDPEMPGEWATAWISPAGDVLVGAHEDRSEAFDVILGVYRESIIEDSTLQVAELSGRDLACWCPLDQPCHADVLLDLANPASSQEGTK